MPRLPDPIFNDSLECDSQTLSLSQACLLALVCVLSIGFALVVALATGAKAVYGLPTVVGHVARQWLIKFV